MYHYAGNDGIAITEMPAEQGYTHALIQADYFVIRGLLFVDGGERQFRRVRERRDYRLGAVSRSQQFLYVQTVYRAAHKTATQHRQHNYQKYDWLQRLI